MSDLISVPRSEWVSMKKVLAMVLDNEKANDLINRDQVMEIMGISNKTLSNYIGQGKVIVASRNKAGQTFFSRKQILGL